MALSTPSDVESSAHETSVNDETVNETVSIDKAELDDLLNDYEWEMMQSESSDSSIDNASIYRIAENTSDMVPLLLCANFLLVLVLGVLLSSIFSNFIKGD